MAQKKCSKCGELNPPEAVMCWACYTPLSGGGTSAAAMSLGGGAAHASSKVTRIKKAVEPWQLGVIGVGILIAVVMGARSLMGSGGEAKEIVSTAPPSTAPDSTSYASQPVATVVASSGGGGGGPIQPTALPAPGQMAFTVSVPPKRGVSWATMAIVPTQANTTPQAAASLAAAARQQMVSSGKWSGMYIYVFRTQESAARLRSYQSQRGGKPLAEDDYQALRNIWPSALARYEYSKGWEAIRYPSASPTGWWQGKSKYNKAQL